MRSYNEVNAVDAIGWHRPDFERLMMMTGSKSVHVVVGWTPPSNSFGEGAFKVGTYRFGPINDVVEIEVMTLCEMLLRAVGLAAQQRGEPIDVTELVAASGLHFGYAVEEDVIVVCLSDSELTTFDFCARLAENIVQWSASSV